MNHNFVYFVIMCYNWSSNHCHFVGMSVQFCLLRLQNLSSYCFMFVSEVCLPGYSLIFWVTVRVFILYMRGRYIIFNILCSSHILWQYYIYICMCTHTCRDRREVYLNNTQISVLYVHKKKRSCGMKYKNFIM